MKTPKTPRASRLDALLTAHGVAPKDWDVVLCGDGSGSGWDTGIGGGYAAFIVDKVLQAREYIAGGCTKTTVNRMELGAYIQALSYHYYGLAGGRLPHTPYNVWIFTDSEITAKVGAGIYATKSNMDLWHMVTWFECRGYRLNWRHVKRNSTDFHYFADALAGAVRVAATSVAVATMDAIDIPVLMPYSEERADTAAVCAQCKTPLQQSLTSCPICGQERSSSGKEESKEESESGEQDE